MKAMKTLFATGFARDPFAALGQDEPTTMPYTSETEGDQPLMYMPPSEVSTPSVWNWDSIFKSAAKAAISIKYPELRNNSTPAVRPATVPSSTGTVLAVLGGAAALGLGAYLIFKKK